MLKIGLTGGIGSGKTTIAKIFVNLGIPVFFADSEARKLMEESSDVIRSVKSSFGDASYIDNHLNRKFLANVVFSDPVKLKKLNSIVHPAVHKQFETWAVEYSDKPYLIEEAALLFETGIYKTFDYIVLVTAPVSKRIERVMSRDKVTDAEVLKRMEAQMTDEEKIINSHFLIFNDDQNLVLNQTLALHEKLISLNN